MWRGRALYVGPVHDTAPHAHHALQLAFALGGQFRIRTDSDWRDAKSALLRSDEEHQLSGGGGEVALVYLDPHSALAAGLDEESASGIADGRAGGPADSLAEDLEARLTRCREAGATLGEADAALHTAVAALSRSREDRPRQDRPRIDARIAQTIRYLESLETKKLPLDEAAARVGLSPGRLGHLFREQVGLPFRRYLLWLRLQDALSELADGASLTEAAHGAGFADSAHLSRTFRRNFGTTLSEAAAAATMVTVAN